MSTSGNILSADSGLDNDSSRFGDHEDWERNIHLWGKIGKSLENPEVCHILDFLVRFVVHLLVNVHHCHCFSHILSCMT